MIDIRWNFPVQGNRGQVNPVPKGTLGDVGFQLTG